MKNFVAEVRAILLFCNVLEFWRVARNSQWGAVLGIWGKAPSRRRHGGFDKKVLPLKRGFIEIGSANMIKLVA